MSSGNKDKRSKKLLFMMIFALLLLNAGLFYVIFANKQEAEKQKVELVDTQAEVAELEELTEELRVNLEAKTGKNAQLDSIIRVRDTELQAQVRKVRNMLSSGNLTKSELAKAKEELSGLRGQIEQLTAEIEQLSKENQFLKDENYVIQKQVEAEKEKVAEMVVVNTDLTKQVAVGSRIFLKGLDVQPLRDAIFGDFKTTDKISKLDKIDISYQLANNDLAEKGSKMLYFQVVKPTKSVLTNSNAGSGLASFDGGEKQYTVKKSINFQNKNESGSFSIPKTEGMTAGQYTVNVFSDEHKMGSAEFTLK
ncbi:MAG: flagellar basal body-associated protein FliL [Pseudoalteromonas distincta]|jgi:flagellar basal body-associated protein FliL